MRLPSSPLALLLALGVSGVAAAGWGFSDATLTVSAKGAGVGSSVKEKLSEVSPLAAAVDLGSQDTLKLLLTAQDGKTAKQPHQAFLNLLDPSSGLETSFPFTVKENGKAKVELTQKDVPAELLRGAQPLTASIVLASFGSSKPYKSPAFSLAIKVDTGSPAAPGEPPLRYGKLPEIHHIFRDDPKNPPVIISLFFTAAVLAALPVLLGTWLFLGANASGLSAAFAQAPVAHALFYGAVVAMEAVFFMYYTTWNLFKMLPVALGIGAVIFVSGSRALTEVQERRLAGHR